MKLLHNKSFRTVTMAAGICIFGFLLTYLSSAIRSDQSQNTVAPPSLPTENTVSSGNSVNTEETEDSKNQNGVANYYIRLTRGLSSSEDALILTVPSQLKASVEYRGETYTSILTEEEKIQQLLDPLQNSALLPDETTVVSTSSSRAVSLILPYSDGFGNLYVFEGYPNGSKKAVTLIQDNKNHLYQAKADVASRLFDLVKPMETSLDAERLNIYSTRDYTKSILQAQSNKESDYSLLLSVLNSLEKQGSSLDLDSPDYLITLLPSNSVQETDYCYLWLDEKQLKISFADDPIPVYRSTDVTSSQMKQWIKEHSVK
ncbi:MAG: hypothetical protein ACI4L5_03685 [Negativibacillus sp.]